MLPIFLIMHLIQHNWFIMYLINAANMLRYGNIDSTQCQLFIKFKIADLKIQLVTSIITNMLIV